MLQTVEGIFRSGRLVLNEMPRDLEEARVLVTFLAPESGARSEATARVLQRLKRGCALGGPPYPAREEIHGRNE